MKGEGKNVYLMVSRYMGIAVMLPVATFIGYVIGTMLDREFDTHFLMPTFLVIGIVAGFVQLIRELQKDTKPDP